MLTPEQQQRIDDQLRMLDWTRTWIPAGRTPYQAHFRIASSSGSQTDLLLGTEMRASPGLAMVDWRTAPLAEVFFGFTEGEEYQIELENRVLEGALLERNLVGFERGELVEIATPAELLTRRGSGSWRSEPLAPRPRLDGGQGPWPVRRSPADLDLDPDQTRVVELPPGRAALVLGEAGSGKTVVALHRLARLHALGGPRFRAAVIVPTEGLRAWIESLLERFQMPEVEVYLYDRFAASQARRRFPDLPRRESQNTSAGVIRFKRHPALRVALAELAKRPPPVPEEGRPRRPTKALARWDDLHELYGDRQLMEQVVAQSERALGAGMVRDVAAQARIQFSVPAEEEFAGVIASATQTLDGRPIDDGTPMEDAASVDVEDYAVMFELDRLRAAARGGKPAEPKPYDCVVLDEAQELAPLELSLVGRSLARKGTLLVAGDADQQVDPTSTFQGWQTAMVELGAVEYQTTQLAVSYRCPPEVTAWARRLRDGAVVDGQVASAGKGGPGGIALALFESECQLLDWLGGELRAIYARDPGASVAVVARTPEAAQLFGRILNYGLTVRVALEGRFTFGPGVQVTCVEEVKGLEFDYVVVPDAGALVYPDTAESRRALYVAATRAIRQLLLACAGRPSRLVAGLTPG
jgi:hypothetical protein